VDGAEIRVEGVSFNYKDTGFSLKNISISVRRGKIVSLLGPNGSGKTTLTKIVLGVLKPVPPNVFVGERNMYEMSDRERARTIAWVPQEVMRSVPLRVIDYVLLGRTPHVSPISTPSDMDERIAFEALKKFGLESYADRYFSQLSGGERRMVSIARAYAQGAPFIVLDEPTAYLDFRNKIAVLKIMKELAESGKGILFTTHDPNEAIAVADEAVVMARGEVIIRGPPSLTLNKEVIEKVYGVHVKMIRTDGREFVAPAI